LKPSAVSHGQQLERGTSDRREVCWRAVMATRPGNGWWQRLRERGVIRVAASYAVIAWLLLQIADVTFEPLGVPRWVMVSLIVAALVGFPIAVALAWFYEVGDRGVERDTARDGSSRPVTHGARRYADVVIIAVLVVAVAVLLVRQSRVGGDDGRPDGGGVCRSRT
jgi:hypothetical protein